MVGKLCIVVSILSLSRQCSKSHADVASTDASKMMASAASGLQK